MVTVKDFQIPYTWQERHVVISNRCWFVPCNPIKNDFTFPGWDCAELFAKPQPVWVEYCSGNGSWIIDQAKKEPGKNWLAIEKRFDRARKIWVKATREKLGNLAVALAEGLSLTAQFFPSESIEKVFVNFPDPWPKRRHEKHRIISSAFVEELSRILSTGSKVILVTDDPECSAYMCKKMLAHPKFQSDCMKPYFIEAPTEYGSSFFDTLFRSHNKTIRLHSFTKRD